MTLKLKTAPAALIEVADAKAWLGVTDEDQASVIQTIVNSVTRWLDGPDGVLGRCLITQAWEWYPDAFPNDLMEVPLGDLLALTSIEYKDPATGTYATWSPANYSVDLVAGLIKANTSWPTPKTDVLASIRITFDAGFGSTPGSVPAPIIEAAMMMIADRYDNRGAVAFDATPAIVPMGVDAKLANFRRVKF